MKRLLSIISLMLISISLFADDFVVDGIKYRTTSSNTVEVVNNTLSGNTYSGDIVIPDNVENDGIIYSVTSIGDYAFCFCHSLTSVTIPYSVTSIGRGAFSETGWYNSQPDGVLYIDNWLIGYKGEKPTEAIIITEGTRGIADCAFRYCSGLTSITIPNSVTSIGRYAFTSCGLTSVTIGNGVTSIGEGAFEECSNFGSVIIHDIAAWCNISFGDNKSNPLYYAHHLYLGDEEIKHLIIPNTVTSISDLAFKDCTGITSVTIPNSVTTIGKGCLLYTSDAADE